MSALFNKKITKNIFRTPLLRNIFLLYLAIAILLPVYHTIFEAPLFNKMVIESAEDDAKIIALHLATMTFPDSNKLERDYFLNNDVITKFEKIVKDFQLEKIKMFSKSGEIVYSSDPGDIGKINRKDYFREIVKKGNIYSKVVKKDTKTIEDRTVKSDVVEIYIPLMKNGAFHGALEIYYDITSKKEKLNNLLLHSMYILSPMVLIALISIVLFLFNTSKISLERLHQEEALRESEEKYQTILATIEDSYFEVNQRGEITFFNEAFSKIIGYPPDELMGMKNDKYLDQKSRRKVFKMFNAVWKTGIPIKLFEYELIRKNGEKRTVQTSISLMTDENGQKVGFRGIIRDVSYHKLMENALRESEEKYRLLIENANDSIFIAQDESIKFPNPKGVEMTGYSAEELAKMPFINLIHPDDRDMVLDRHKRRLSGEKLPTTYEFRMINKAGEKLWVELNTAVINWEERPATLNLLRDITPQKKLEAQLQQTQKMEAIGTLAGGIAHEFNNALTGVVGNIELLEMRLPDNKIVTEHTE
ncbi:hypothetical protein LCGC14_2110090, partial [marine sediment metagenome]